MTGRPRRIRSPAFWAKVASAAIGGEKTLASLAGPFDVHPSRNEPRPPQLRVGASGVFGAVAALEVAADVEMRTLHATIGELTLRNDFLSGAFGIGRSGACCPPRTTSDPEPA